MINGNNINKMFQSKKTQSDITLILKCTRQCNLSCNYCLDRRAKPLRKYDILFMANLFDGIRHSEKISRVTFIWHGGEPLLLGIPFFRKVYFLQKRMLPNIKLVNTIQTNGTLLNEDWINHFLDYNFQIGVSFDGPKEIQDSTRRFPNGENSFDRVVESIRLLSKYNLSYGVLTVISDDHLQMGPEHLMEFYDNNSIERYALLSLRKDWNKNEDALAYNRNFGEYMSKALKHWLEKDSSTTNIRELESKMDLFFGLPNSVCKDGGPCVGKYYGIEADGGVWHCDKFFDNTHFYFGNVLNEDFDKLINSSRVEKAYLYELSVRQKCESCEWFKLCKGGCLSDLIYLHKIGGNIGTPDCINYRIYEEMSIFLSDCYVNNFEE